MKTGQHRIQLNALTADGGERNCRRGEEERTFGKRRLELIGLGNGRSLKFGIGSETDVF